MLNHRELALLDQVLEFALANIADLEEICDEHIETELEELRAKLDNPDIVTPKEVEHRIAVDYATETGGKCSCGADGYVCTMCKKALCAKLAPPELDSICPKCMYDGEEGDCEVVGCPKFEYCGVNWGGYYLHLCSDHRRDFEEEKPCPGVKNFAKKREARRDKATGILKREDC